ncbi:MAG: hypothetical protein Q4B26_04525 [Eubacteriales bacterium]|nr:hypothetical protein [Eubacteriales bacterium]
MSFTKMTATYLVDDSYLLHLKETGDGFEYHCFDQNEKKQIAAGLVEYGVIENSPVAGILPGVRAAVFHEIGIPGEKVATVSQQMLEQFPEGRKLLYQMEKEADFKVTEKSIRFITSQYEDKFKMPEGGVVTVTYPDRSFSAKCEYIDDYHMRLGHDGFHICQFAEMLERSGGRCEPEAEIQEPQAAWDIGRKGFLAVQIGEGYYDYTLYDSELNEIDGGQIDDPEMSINAFRDEILSEFSWDKRTMVSVDYEVLMEQVEEKETARLADRKVSVLESLNGLKNVSSEPSSYKPKQEVER